MECWIYFIMYDIYFRLICLLLEVREKEGRGFLKAAPGPAHHPAKSGEEEGFAGVEEAADEGEVLSGLMLRHSCVRQTKEFLGIVI
jgi:hypothetical protein